MIHTTPKYLLKPQHPITVNLIGCGGTGSQMLTRLAQIDHALKAGGLGLGDHAGLLVNVYDPDVVTSANIGRQAFLPSDVGLYKATVLVSRINRAFGLRWQAHPMRYDRTVVANGGHKANIIITCVDSVQARIEVSKMQGQHADVNAHAYERQYYWLDLGNSQHTGQVVLGTLWNGSMSKSSEMVNWVELPTITERFDLRKHDNVKEQGHSCSVAESLATQDLCINSMLAEWGKKLLWNLFKQMQIQNCGVFVNLQDMIVNPIPVPEKPRKQRKPVPKAKKKGIRKLVRR